MFGAIAFPPQRALFFRWMLTIPRLGRDVNPTFLRFAQMGSFGVAIRTHDLTFGNLSLKVSFGDTPSGVGRQRERFVPQMVVLHDVWGILHVAVRAWALLPPLK